MAVRPLVTTGAALLSAGALVAATPALFVPHDEVTIEASAAAPVAPKLTDQQVQLLAFTVQGAIDSFFLGYGGFIDPEYSADGFLGLAYYSSDQLLPLGDIDNIVFEAGIVPLVQVVAADAAATVDSIDPTGRLDLEKRVNDFFDGGVTLLVQNLINDNLPDDELGEWAKGLNDSFFDGGVVAAVTYVLQTIGVVTPPPEEEEVTEELTTLSKVADEEVGDTTPKPTFGGPATTFKLPDPTKLLKLPAAPTTPEVEEVEEPEAPVKPTKPLQNVVKVNPLADLAENLPFGKPTGKGGGAFAKGDTNGQNFVKQLKEAFKPKPKPAADSEGAGDADAGDSGDE